MRGLPLRAGRGRSDYLGTRDGLKLLRSGWSPRMVVATPRQGESFDPMFAWSGKAAAAGFLHMVKMFVEDPTVTIANAHWYPNVGGSGLTSNQCFAFLYNSAGTLIAKSADLSASTALTGTGFKTVALTAESGQSLQLGGPGVWVNVGLLINGSSMPSFLSHDPGGGFAWPDWGATNDITGWRAARPNTGGTTSVPSTRPALIEDMGRMWWMGVS